MERSNKQQSNSIARCTIRTTEILWSLIALYWNCSHTYKYILISSVLFKSPLRCFLRIYRVAFAYITGPALQYIAPNSDVYVFIECAVGLLHCFINIIIFLHIYICTVPRSVKILYFIIDCNFLLLFVLSTRCTFIVAILDRNIWLCSSQGIFSKPQTVWVKWHTLLVKWHTLLAKAQINYLSRMAIITKQKTPCRCIDYLDC